MPAAKRALLEGANCRRMLRSLRLAPSARLIVFHPNADAVECVILPFHLAMSGQTMFGERHRYQTIGCESLCNPCTQEPRSAGLKGYHRSCPDRQLLGWAIENRRHSRRRGVTFSSDDADKAVTVSAHKLGSLKSMA